LALIELRKLVLASAPETEIAPALEALAQTLPAETRRKKGTKMGDAFIDVESAVKQLLLATDPKAEWFHVLGDAARDALTDFENALSAEQLRYSGSSSNA